MKLSGHLILPILVGALTGGFISCNTEDVGSIYTSYSNTMVCTFAFSSDINVLPNLPYRYFTIDLVEGRIFNPDSFPYGTDISALVPDITFSSPSSVEITVRDKSDTSNVLKTIDYLKNDNDSIDFNNEVRMRVVAADGITAQNYRIDVRVHQVQADSLVWTTRGTHSLPTKLATPLYQKTVLFRNKIYCFTADAKNYNIGTTETPTAAWTTGTFSPYSDTMSIASITASADSLYALCGQPDDAGNMSLAASSDGVTWTARADIKFSSLIGMWENTLVGLTRIDGEYCHAAYCNGIFTAGDPIESSFPVSGYSATIARRDTSYGTSQIYFFGGCAADRSLSSGIWAYDGEHWAVIADVGLSGGAGAAITPREGALFFSYYQDEYDPEEDLFHRKVYYYIIGGRDATGPRNDLYYTNTIGGYWERAAQGTPLSLTSAGFTPRAFASVLVEMENNVTTVSSEWRMLDVPDYFRAVRSENETVPYIYVFGGYDQQDVLLDEISRGVIRRFTF